MAYVDWRIEGDKIGACNCAFGCPCEFNALPTHGQCEGLEIETGHFGDIRLDGLRVAALVSPMMVSASPLLGGGLLIGAGI